MIVLKNIKAFGPLSSNNTAIIEVYGVLRTVKLGDAVNSLKVVEIYRGFGERGLDTVVFEDNNSNRWYIDNFTKLQEIVSYKNI